MASIYDRMGGPTTVRVVAGEFRKRLLEDGTLAPFFARTDLARLERRFAAYLTAALGGPDPDPGPSMLEAHQGRGIQLVHFTLATGHLAAALRAAAVPAPLVHDVLHVVAPLADDIAADSLEPAADPA